MELQAINLRGIKNTGVWMLIGWRPGGDVLKSDGRIPSGWKQSGSQTPMSREIGESRGTTILLTMTEMKMSTEPQRALRAQQAPSSTA